MQSVDEWDLVWRIGLALALSASIGLDREMRQKSAGLRTYTLVGIGSALFMLISKYGFFDVLRENEVVLDPSRMAAQIVSGIGFIGAGLIFVRRDSVRGLTTAASVWVTAAIGSAAGAGLRGRPRRTGGGLYRRVPADRGDGVSRHHPPASPVGHRGVLPPGPLPG